MDDNGLKPEENGINPVDTASNRNDVYFSNVKPNEESTPVSAQKVAPQPKRTAPKAKKSHGIAGTYIFFIIVIVCSMALSVYAVFCLNDILAITKTNSSVTVSLDEEVETIDEAVDILADNGLIRCKNFCKLFAKYREAEVGAPYEAGVYYLTGKMGLEGMLMTMHGDSATAETVTLTFPEGYTVPEIIDRLVDNEVCDKASLLSVIETVDFTYSLVSDLTSDESVPYRLEGYLFPDTYDFYIGESASSVIKKFLSNGDTKITEEYREKAEKMGYSMHEIIIIASIIQSEAGDSDQMATISSVIHNRLADSANFPYIGCESTLDYINNKVSPSLTSTSSHTASYYTQYYDTVSTKTGLPASPICNPGIEAIEAALNPDDTDYYYFFHDKDGNMYTAKTYTEFRSKVATYAPYLDY
ncbi:MAG: endolytic transglycosylase MltG [Clostridiales bacterium]|nr:endolytic transglycosylase MltG [Clostridiales bacterium]